MNLYLPATKVRKKSETKKSNHNNVRIDMPLKVKVRSLYYLKKLFLELTCKLNK